MKLPFKIHNPQSGTLFAATAHAEDAAALVGALGDGCTIRVNGWVCWTEGEECISAAESYDGATEIMHSRLYAHFKRTAVREALGDKINELETARARLGELENDVANLKRTYYALRNGSAS